MALFKKKGAKTSFKSPLEVLQEKKRNIQEVNEFKRRQFARSIPGKVSSFLLTPNVRSFYGFDALPMKSVKAVSGRGRGRPRGSFDPRYVKFGGVYGYRKVLNAQLRERRLETLRRLSVNPQQQAILSQIEARERARQGNPENKVIPDTKGYSFMGGYNQEIDDAANAVP